MKKLTGICWEDKRKGKDHSKIISGRMQIMANLLIRTKARKSTGPNFMNANSGPIPKGNGNRISKSYLHSCVLCSTILNSQDTEIT